jgi:hypothetical protein
MNVSATDFVEDGTRWSGRINDDLIGRMIESIKNLEKEVKSLKAKKKLIMKNIRII